VEPANLESANQKLESSTALSQFFDKRGVVEALVCAVTALAYLGTMSFGFIYDDKPVIVDDESIRSWHFLTQYFIPTATSSKTFYRPITLLWLRLNYVVFGLNPAGWHFAMLACHVLMTYLVFIVAAKLSSNRTVAALAAILFGLHPIHVENVAWLSSVNDLLMSVFLLASFFSYLKFRDGRKAMAWFATSVLCFLLALLSKETTAVFPVLIVGFAVLFPLGRVAGDSRRGWAVFKNGLVSIPYFAVLAGYLGARSLMLHGLVQPIAPLSWRTMILTAPSILWFDVKHLLLPIYSSEFYSMAYVTSLGFENFVLPIILLAGILIAVAYWISTLAQPRLGIFAAAWAIVTILPTLYLRAIAPGNFVHDRFLYLPSVGMVILVGLAVDQISSSQALWAKGSGATIKWAVVGILCTTAFAGTISHQVQWASDLLLYQNAIKYAPQNPIVMDNLANEFANTGRYDRALPLYLSALQLDPGSWLSNYNLGYAYYRTGSFPEAVNYLTRAIQIDDKDPDQFIFLARAQMEQGEMAKAQENAEQALQRGPLSPGFHFVLARILEARGDREGAIAEYRAEVAAHPENGLAVNEIQRLQSTQ
jgi:Tfp pilus assembly protein PilF